MVELQYSGSIPIAVFGMLNQAHRKYFIATKSMVSILPVAFPQPPPTAGEARPGSWLCLQLYLHSSSVNPPLHNTLCTQGRRAELAAVPLPTPAAITAASCITLPAAFSCRTAGSKKAVFLTTRVIHTPQLSNWGKMGFAGAAVLQETFI